MQQAAGNEFRRVSSLMLITERPSYKEKAWLTDGRLDEKPKENRQQTMNGQ